MTPQELTEIANKALTTRDVSLCERVYAGALSIEKIPVESSDCEIYNILVDRAHDYALLTVDLLLPVDHDIRHESRHQKLRNR